MRAYFLILFSLSLIIFAGCKRFKEGPLFSFHTAEHRMRGQWKVISFTGEGVDSMSYIYRYHLDDKWSFSYYRADPTLYIDYNDSAIFAGYRSSLEFTNKISFVPWEGNYWIFKSKWTILRLKEDDMKWETNYNGIDYIIHFKPY